MKNPDRSKVSSAFIRGMASDIAFLGSGLPRLQGFEYATTPDEKSVLGIIATDINVPPDLLEKYYSAFVKVADQCAV